MTVFKPEALFEALASGHTVVTGNSRLARVLSGRYGRWRMAAGDRQWPSPAIRSWAAWVDRLWERATLGAVAGHGAVPGREQVLSLWESVLREDSANRHLLRAESLAPLAAETRRLVVEWAVDTGHPAWFEGEANENHAAFRRWNRAFEALCVRKGWVPPEDRLPILTRAAREGLLQSPGPVLTIGFDELSPVQAAFLEALAAGGSPVETLEPQSRAGRAVQWKAADARSELDRMARWVRHRHETSPDAAIGVVVPGLAARRQEVERQLHAILTPGEGSGPAPWNISMGAPLASEPVIAAAFDLLRLAAKHIDVQDAGRVLNAPWFSGSHSERPNRALLEKLLREEYPRRFDLDELRFRAGEERRRDHRGNELPKEEWAPQPWQSPEMKKIAADLQRFFRESRPRLPSAWAEAFDALLAAAGWPRGDGSEETGEHDRNWQAYRHWQEALRTFSSLDATGGPIALGEALARLHRACRETVFQPRTPPATIQVLGPYEAIGLSFDHLWVLGLHNDNWPPAPQRNPFIPVGLQLEAGLPQSGPQRELEVARRVTRRLLDSSADCVFSYPGLVDGEETLPSPLLTAAGIEHAGDVPGWEEHGWPRAIFESRRLETIPLSGPGPLCRETARGGTDILKNQAACPFRAFAVNRLGAEGMETPADGITPRLHGSLLHKVLEGFWGEVRKQETLLEMDDSALRASVVRHVEQALQERRDMKFRPAFRQVEAERLSRLSLEHLALEKQRAPFEAVGFEQVIEHRIGGQLIRLVIDRIDRLPDGETLIIDYKTGSVKPQKWFGERPEEPQLPLYAVSAGETPAAVVYAVIRSDGCQYLGLVSAPGLFPGLPQNGKRYEYLVEAGRDLPGTTAEWKEILHRLMAEFLAGEAAVAPLKGRKSCDATWCELQPLCRIDELEQLQDPGGAR